MDTPANTDTLANAYPQNSTCLLMYIEWMKADIEV